MSDPLKKEALLLITELKEHCGTEVYDRQRLDIILEKLEDLEIIILKVMKED